MGTARQNLGFRLTRNKINFDVTSSDWGFTSELDFKNLFLNQGATDCIVKNFNLMNGRLTCFLKFKDLEYVSLQSLNIVDVTIININGILGLFLQNNQIENFNPIKLPTNLNQLYLENNLIQVFNYELPSNVHRLFLNNNNISSFSANFTVTDFFYGLNLRDNNLTLASYAAIETWANNLPIFTNICEMDFNNNVDSISGTNLEAILITKNVIVIS